LPQLNWEDLRIFLEVARAGSLRRAGFKLGLNHSTASRRIAAIEADLGARLFDRTPSGLSLTDAGRMVLASAERMSHEVDDLGRRLLGHDDRLEGPVRLSMPDHLVGLLMPHFAHFQESHPEITLDLHVSYESVSLTRREADVALRLVRDQPSAEGLVGRKVSHYVSATYATREYLEQHDLAAEPPTARWIGWGDAESLPEWVRRSPFPTIPTQGSFSDGGAQIAAVIAGMGLAMIPCFLGDRTPGLVRVAGAGDNPGWNIWVLTHPDLRQTARVRVLLDSLYAAFDEQRPLLEGRKPAALYTPSAPHAALADA
jgi:DNA-binding transcriptional LysR family regulator